MGYVVLLNNENIVLELFHTDASPQDIIPQDAISISDENGEILRNSTLSYKYENGILIEISNDIPDSIKEIIKNRKIEELWQAATNYQERYISGAAIGLLTIGVIQNKPKSLAVMAWINTIWNNHYYPQKALIAWDSSAYDFSVCGSIPYTVPEISAEVLG